MPTLRPSLYSGQPWLWRSPPLSAWLPPVVHALPSPGLTLAAATGREPRHLTLQRCAPQLLPARPRVGQGLVLSFPE